MRYLLTSLLVILLAGVVVGFMVLGLRQRWRRRRLVQRCGASGLDFVPNGPFGAPRQYGDFALMSAGHSPRAENVARGRCSGGRLQAFDLSYEVGHGIRRSSRNYVVVVVEGEYQLGDVLMWHHDDAAGAPLQAAQAERAMTPWVFRGDTATAERLAKVSGDLGGLSASLQALRGVLMICAPAGQRDTYERLSAAAVEICEILASGGASGGAI